jgi:hypothetical protein
MLLNHLYLRTIIIIDTIVSFKLFLKLYFFLFLFFHIRRFVGNRVPFMFYYVNNSIVYNKMLNSLYLKIIISNSSVNYKMQLIVVFLFNNWIQD